MEHVLKYGTWRSLDDSINGGDDDGLEEADDDGSTDEQQRWVYLCDTVRFIDL